MRNINFILKFLLASFFFIFALWYDHILYNVIVGLTLILILIKEKISPFRFQNQFIVFSIFLFIIFLFQSFNGYGKILLNLPFNLTLTDEGILTAFKFVTQILLIFLLFGTAIYSSKKREILFYFRKSLKILPVMEQSLEKYFRIGMFSFYMVPNSLKIQGHFKKTLQTDPQIQKSGIRQRVNLVFDNIYQFIKVILKKGEEEYPEFVTQNNRAANYSPIRIGTIKNILIIIFVLIIHSILIWN